MFSPPFYIGSNFFARPAICSNINFAIDFCYSRGVCEKCLFVSIICKIGQGFTFWRDWHIRRPRAGFIMHQPLAIAHKEGMGGVHREVEHRLAEHGDADGFHHAISAIRLEDVVAGLRRLRCGKFQHEM